MRKEPRQERSRETVEAILEATTRILERRGWSGITTNEVAEVAGVSVGSLYQYFPNKLSLTEALRRRHFEEVLAALGAAGSHTRPVEALVDAMISLHSRHPAVHHTLLEEAPRSRDSQAAHGEFEAEYLRRYEKLIAPRSGRVIAAQVLSAAVAGVVHDAARRGTIASPALRRELIRMVSGYLEAKLQCP